MPGLKHYAPQVQDLETDSKARDLGFFRVGISTFHDAFARYSGQMFAQIFALLAERFPLEKVSELAALGQMRVSRFIIFRGFSGFLAGA